MGWWRMRGGPEGIAGVGTAICWCRMWRADMGDLCEPLRAVSIKGPRNWWSSGKVVVGSGKAIEGLKGRCGDLKQGGATIPAADRMPGAVWGADFNDPSGNPACGWRVCWKRAGIISGDKDGRGAVVPVWFTVKVPGGCETGDVYGAERRWR